MQKKKNFKKKKKKGNEKGPVRESNPGPLAPEARIIPLDQQAKYSSLCENRCFKHYIYFH